MATVTVLKLTEIEATIKYVGEGADTHTIDLDVDLLLGARETIDGTPTVNITSLGWTGGANGAISITRNSALVSEITTGTAGVLDFTGVQFEPDTQENTSDIVISSTGTSAILFIKLKKVAGFKTNSLDVNP